jgi:hypothetical protein
MSDPFTPSITPKPIVAPQDNEEVKQEIASKPMIATPKPIVEPIKEETTKEASKTEAPKVPVALKEKISSKNYEQLNISVPDNLNPFKSIKINQFIVADEEQRSELVSSSLSLLNEQLLADGAVVPSVRVKDVNGEEVEEIVNAKASVNGRLTEAGLDYYNKTSYLLGEIAKDKNAGVRVNPFTGKPRPTIGGKLITPYSSRKMDKDGFVTDTEGETTGVEYKPLTEDDVVGYEHVRDVLSARAMQAGVTLKTYLGWDKDLFSFVMDRETVTEEWNTATDGTYHDNLELVAKIKNSPSPYDIKDQTKAEQQFLQSVARLKAEQNMGDKLADIYQGSPIFNTAKIKNLVDLESAIAELPMAKHEKQTLLINFKTNFESRAIELITQQSKTGPFGLDKITGNRESIENLFLPENLETNITSPTEWAESGQSAYDYVKENADLYDTNVVASSVEKLINGTINSFDNTRVALMSLGAGAIEGASRAVSLDGVANTMQDARLALAEGKAALNEMKEARSEQLGKSYLLGEEGDSITITDDDIFDAAGNIAEMYLTLGSSGLAKLGTLPTRTMSIAAAKEVGKKSAAKIALDTGKASKLVDFKEAAKAVWTNAEAVNTASGVLKTSTYGGLTSAGGGIGEGYARAIRAGKNEDEALVHATITGLSNGIATFTAMTIMNGLLPQFGVEKGLIKASEGVSLRSAINNTIARNKASNTISKSLSELVKDASTLKLTSKAVVDSLKSFTKNNGLSGFSKSVGYGMIAEGVEEWGDEMLSPVIQAYLFKDEWARKHLETTGYWHGAIKAGIIGMMMGGASASFSKTADAKQKAFDYANQRMDQYMKEVVPSYEGMRNEKVSVKSTTDSNVEVVDTLQNILNTGTLEQKVQALTELGTQRIQTIDPNAAPAPDAPPSTEEMSDINTGDSNAPNNEEAPAVKRNEFSLSKGKNTTAQVKINAPVENENQLATHAYKESNGVDVKESDLGEMPTLQVSGQEVFNHDNGSTTVTSYNINNKKANIHSFQNKNGETVFVAREKLGKALAKEYAGTVLKNLNKISGVNEIAGLIKEVTPDVEPEEIITPSTPQTKINPSKPQNVTTEVGNKLRAQKTKTTKVTDQGQTPEIKEEQEEESKSQVEVEEKPEDIYNEDKNVVGEKKLSPRLAKAFNKYKTYLNSKKIGVIIVSNAEELKNIPELAEGNENAVGVAATLNRGKKNEQDVIVILIDKIEARAKKSRVSVSTIFEETLQHENFHIINLRYDKTPEGKKLKDKFESDLLESEKMNNEMDVDYPGFSKLPLGNKFYEFTRSFIAGKLTKRTLSLMMSISPAMKKWLKGFLKFAKKEVSKNKGAEKYLAGLENAYIEAIKDDAALFKYGPSATEAFKNFVSKIYAQVSPSKSRKKVKGLASREIAKNEIDSLANEITTTLDIGLDDNVDPKELVEKIIGAINSWSQSGVGLDAQSQKAVFNKIVEDWRNNEGNQDILKALQDSANRIGAEEKADHISDPLVLSSQVVLDSIKEKKAYNEYTRIRKTIDKNFVMEDKVEDVKNVQEQGEVSGEVTRPISVTGNAATNAYVEGKIDPDTGEIVGLGLEVGDVVSVLDKNNGNVVRYLVYSKSQIVINEKGEKKAQHRFISGVTSENGTLTTFGKGLQSLFSDKFRKDFLDSGLVDKMFKDKNGLMELTSIDELLQFVFNTLTSKSINNDGVQSSSIEVAGVKYEFNDLFQFDIDPESNSSSTSPFYYKDGAIMVKIDALRREFQFIDSKLLKDEDNKNVIGLLVAQAIRTAIDEELLHHITTKTFSVEDIISLYDDLDANERFKTLVMQIAKAQGIDIKNDKIDDAKKYVIATEFLAFINQKSFDGVTYSDQYNQLLSSYASLNPDGKALNTAMLYGKRYRDILVSRSATSLMAPRLIEMINKLSVIKRTTMPRYSSSNMANVYANFNKEIYENSKSNMQKIIDNAFIKQFSAVNDLRTSLAEAKIPSQEVLEFDFENMTVKLNARFSEYYKTKVDAQEFSELNDYFSRLNNDNVIRQFISTIASAKARLDSVTEQVASTTIDPQLDTDLGVEFQQATRDYNNLVLNYSDIILNKNLTKVDEFGRSFAKVGTEIGINVSPIFVEQTINPNAFEITGGTTQGVTFSYDGNLFGYENQSPINAINNRIEQNLVFERVGGDIERAKTEQLWVFGYIGRYTGNDRVNFPEKVSQIEANAAFLGEEEFNYFYVSRINGESFTFNGNPYSNSDYRKMMGFNIIDFKYNRQGEKSISDFNDVVKKFLIPDTGIPVGVTDSNTKKPYEVEFRKISESNFLPVSQPERRRDVLTRALAQIFGNEDNNKNINEWFENLEKLIGYDRQSGEFNVIDQIAGRETFASKFAKQLKYRMFSDRLAKGTGPTATIEGETDGDPSLFAMLKELQSAYHALWPSTTLPHDVKPMSKTGKNQISDEQISKIYDNLKNFLEGVDALNQDIGLARKAYSRFTSRYLSNTIMGDIRLIQEQNADGIRANQDLIKAIQYSFYDIQAAEDIEFMMDYRNNGGRRGINGIIALNLLDELAAIPSSAQNEYYIGNTPSEKVAYLLERYNMYLENGVNPRVRDVDNKSNMTTDNLVFDTVHQYGDRLDESDINFNDERETKPSDTAETVNMSSVSPVTGRDEASQEAIDSARRESLHQEVKKMKSWVFQAAIGVFQSVYRNNANIGINGIDPARAKKFFYLFAKAQNRPTNDNDFTEEDFDQARKSQLELNDLMLEQLEALASHYKTTGAINPGFGLIADKVRKASYSHPMEFLVDVVELIGTMEKAFLDELTDAGKTLADYAQTQLRKEAAMPQNVTLFEGQAVTVAPVKATAYVDTSSMVAKLEQLRKEFDDLLESPSGISKKVVDNYLNAISELENEISNATNSVGENNQNATTPIKRYVKKDTSELLNKLDEENLRLKSFITALKDLGAAKARKNDVEEYTKIINDTKAVIDLTKKQIEKIELENEAAENQSKTPIDKLQSEYQELRSKLYTAQQKATIDEAGNITPETVQRDVGNEGQFLQRPRVGQTESITINELVADPKIEDAMRRIGVMISELQNLQERPKSMISYNQEQAQLVLDSLSEDAQKGQLVPGTIFYARTFKFKSDQSLIDDKLFIKSPLFSALLQSMPNLIIYQPNTNYEGKSKNLPDGAGLVQFENGDAILYITNPDQLNASKQAQILEQLIISQIKFESKDGKNPSILKQVIDNMADVIRTQVEHAINITPERISILLARAEAAINGIAELDRKVKDVLIERYKNSLVKNAGDSLRLLTNNLARRKYIEDRVSNRTEGISTFFEQLTSGSTTMQNIQMIVEMFTNPDAYRLLSTFKSPDLDFNAYSALPQFDSMLSKALSFFAIPEVSGSLLHDIRMQKNLENIDLDQDEEVYESDVDPNLIVQSIMENITQLDKSKKTLNNNLLISNIKAMSDSQIKELLDPFVMEKYLVGNRNPSEIKDLIEVFRQNNAQPDYLYRFVGSQLMNALTPSPKFPPQAVRETSIFDESFPVQDTTVAIKAYDILFNSGKPILLGTMVDPYTKAAEDTTGNESRVPSGNLTNFYYGHNPLTEGYRVDRRRNLLGMILGKTETGKSTIKGLFEEMENGIDKGDPETFSTNVFISMDDYSGIIANMIEELPALLGNDAVARAVELVDRLGQLALTNREEAKGRILELKEQLELVKQKGRDHLIEKLLERNKQSKEVTDAQLRSIANRISNYIISDQLKLNKNSHNLSEKLMKNADSYFGKYQREVDRLAYYDEAIRQLFDEGFKNESVVKDNNLYRYLINRRNAVVDRAEIYKSEYIKLAAMNLMGEMVNPAYFFGRPNADVQGYIRNILDGMGSFNKFKYRMVSKFDETHSPEATYRSIQNELMTNEQKGLMMQNLSRAFLPDFASELLNGISSIEAKAMFSSLGPDFQKNFADIDGYVQENFKSEMAKEFFRRLKKADSLAQFAQKMSGKIDAKNRSIEGIRRFVLKQVMKDKGIGKFVNNEFIITDVDLAFEDEEGNKILDGNIDAKISEINEEIDRLNAFLNSNQLNPNELRKADMPQTGQITLFEIPAVKYPEESAAYRRMNQNLPPQRRLNIKFTRSLNEKDLNTDQIERVDAISRDAKVINEAMNIFLKEEGESIYRALTEEIDLYGEGFDTVQNIQNVIELAKLRSDLSERAKTKFQKMIQDMGKIDQIMNETNQPALELYGISLRDMMYMKEEAATVVIGKDGEREILMRGKTIKESELERIQKTALFIKNEAGLAVYLPTEGKMKEVEGRSHYTYDRSALEHLKSYIKVTKKKVKAEDLLKGAIFRASRIQVDIDSFLRTQNHEGIKLEGNKAISPDLANATGVNPTTTKAQFIKMAKTLFNQYFLKQKVNVEFSDFAKGIGVSGSIKTADRMNEDQIDEAFDSIYDFASNTANNSILRNSGFESLTKAKKDYDADERFKIVESAHNIVIEENDFIKPDTHSANAIMLNESMLEDVIAMFESERFQNMSKIKALDAYRKAAVDAIASVFNNEINTQNSTVGKFFNSDTAITRLDLRQNYTRLYSLLFAEDIFVDLISGVNNAKLPKDDSNSWFTHSNALVKRRFSRTYGAYQRALNMQSLIEQGLNGNSGRNKYTAKYREYQNRVGIAASEIGNDFDMGSRANMVAITKGILEANNQDGGSDLDLAMKLHYFASAYNNGMRDHRQIIKNASDYKKQGNLFVRGKRFFETVARKQTREDANVQIIDDLIGAEIEAIAYRDPKSMSRKDVEDTIKLLETLLYSGYNTEDVNGMNKYADALLSEFTEIYKGHRIANTFASEDRLRDIDEIVDPEVGKTGKAFRNSYSVLPLRMGYIRNPMSKQDFSRRTGDATIEEFIGFEQSLINYRGRTIADLATDNYVRVLRPIDMNPFTAPDQIANDAMYRMYVNPSYSVIKKLLGEYGTTGDKNPRTTNGHLLGAIETIYNLRGDQNISQIGDYNLISAYLMDNINTEVRNDMPMDLADSLLSDLARMSNVHLMVKTLLAVIQPFAQGVMPGIAKYLAVKSLNRAGVTNKDTARLREAYWLACKGYFVSDGVLARLVKENSYNSYKWIAEGADKRDTQISLTKYADQKYPIYLARYLGRGFNKLGEGALDFVIGRPERAMVQSIYAFELFSCLQEEMGSRAPKTIVEMIKMNPDEFSTYAKTKADTMVTDFMGLGDRAKKAKIYNLAKNYAVTTLLINGLTRYGNHSLTVGPNLMVNTEQLLHQVFNRDHFNDKRMRNEAIENIVGTVFQTALFRFTQTSTLVPIVVYLAHFLAGLVGGGDKEDEETITAKTLQTLRNLDVHGEMDTEDDTFMDVVSRRVRAYTLPEQFSVTKPENRDARLFGWKFKNSPILESNLTALRRSFFDTIPIVPAAGAALSVPPINSAVDVSAEFLSKRMFDENPSTFKVESLLKTPFAPVIESAEGALNNASIPLNYFAPKEGREGISFAELVEGMLVAPLGTREYRPTYYERIERKGGWGGNKF